MKTVASKRITRRTVQFRLGEFYPLAGLVSIALYFVVECLLKIR